MLNKFSNTLETLAENIYEIANDKNKSLTDLIRFCSNERELPNEIIKQITTYYYTYSGLEDLSKVILEYHKKYKPIFIREDDIDPWTA